MEARRLLAVPPGASAPDGAQRTATRDRPRVLSVAKRPRPATEPAAATAALAGPSFGDVGFDLAALLGEKRGNDQPVSVDPERAAPEPFDDFHRALVMDCLDRASMLGRHRQARSLSFRPRIEERLLAQVDGLAMAGMTEEEATAFLDAEVGDDPWATWGAVFALSCLAGTGPLVAVYSMLRTLPEEAREAARHAAAALSASPHPEVEALARDLLDAPEPLARAVGADLLARRGWLSPQQCLGLLGDSHPAVVAAALRAQVEMDPRGRRGAAPAQIPWEAMRAALRAEDPDVVWNAARALIILGDPVPCAEVRSGALAGRLGISSVEALILGGVPDDAERLLGIARGLPLTAPLLDALGRFGHPAARPLLLHALAQPELAEDAVDALSTLFGPVVTGDAALDPRTWTEATSRIDPTRPVRYRRGAPWSARTVAQECASLSLSGDAVALRLDELHARTGAPPMVDVDAFWPDLQAAPGAMSSASA